MRMVGLARIGVVLGLSLFLFSVASSAEILASDAFNAVVASARPCKDLANCGASASSCLGLPEGSPCGPKDKGTCVALDCSSTLIAVCKCDTTVISVDPANLLAFNMTPARSPMNGSCKLR